MSEENQTTNELRQSSKNVSFQIYSKMSYAQKLNEFYKLRDVAWSIKVAGIRNLHPEWNEEQIQMEVKRIFLYANT